jgi:hypothetical protein
MTKAAKWKPPAVMLPLRYAVSGREHGIGVPSVMGFLGKEETLKRVDKCLSGAGCENLVGLTQAL